VSLDTLFGTTHDVSPLQECARAALIFVYGLLMVRIAGRRVFSKWSAVDIIVSIVVGSNLSRALTGSAPLWGTLAATTLLMALHWVLARGAATWPWLSRIVEGPAVRLGEGGQANAAAMRHHNVSEADLHEALHAAGIEQPEETRALVLEPSGKISALKTTPPPPPAAQE
jgi:uncharacterized membrane protein YcaP (DUF421 family)